MNTAAQQSAPDIYTPICWESARDLTQRLSISPSTLHYLINEEGFPKPNSLGQRIVRYNSEQVDKWIAARSKKASATIELAE